MHLKFAVFLILVSPLAACTQAQLDTVNQLALADTGHALPDTPSEESSVVSEPSSVEVPSSSVEVSSSGAEPASSEAQAPCITPIFRVLTCGPNGEWEWW